MGKQLKKMYFHLNQRAVLTLLDCVCESGRWGNPGEAQHHFQLLYWGLVTSKKRLQPSCPTALHGNWLLFQSNYLEVTKVQDAELHIIVCQFTPGLLCPAFPPGDKSLPSQSSGMFLVSTEHSITKIFKTFNSKLGHWHSHSHSTENKWIVFPQMAHLKADVASCKGNQCICLIKF